MTLFCTLQNETNFKEIDNQQSKYDLVCTELQSYLEGPIRSIETEKEK